MSCAHFGLPPYPRRREIIVAVNPVGPDCLNHAATQWPNLFGGARRPHIVLLVGGRSSFCMLDEETTRRLGQEIRAFVEAAGGTVHALTRRRTGERQAEVLKVFVVVITHLRLASQIRDSLLGRQPTGY